MWPSSLTTTPLPYSTPFAGSAKVAGFSGNGEGVIVARSGSMMVSTATS
jgi:hypothetical protein